MYLCILISVVGFVLKDVMIGNVLIIFLKGIFIILVGNF